MMKLRTSMKLHICFAFVISFSWAAFSSAKPDQNAFLLCLSKYSDDLTISSLIYTPKNSSFLSVLDFYTQNLRFINPKTPKPIAVFTPIKESQIQTAIYCAKKHGLQMRVRSGGHDFEGISYISHVPFFILDMFNFRAISVDVETRTAWVGAGATLGETYYSIYEKNSSLSFPAGYWPTVATGGHISGGGYGGLTREYGIAADHVIDARVVDANGKILDRASMGEDLFWAIRGGVGSNFAVITSYKLGLVDVPEKATVFAVSRSIDQNAVQLAHKWQFVAPKLPIKFTFSLQISSVVSPQTGKPTIDVVFLAVYRGAGVDELLSIMSQYFPELGLTKEDCQEILWIQYFPFHIGAPLDNVKGFLTSRRPPGKLSFAGKADFVEEPIPEDGIANIFNTLLEVPPSSGVLEWTILAGGPMDQIPKSEIPFPHRNKLMAMHESVSWDSNDNSTVIKVHLKLLRKLHKVIGRYVPKNPRAAYANYRDYDLGVNNLLGQTSLKQAKKWGIPYFGDNFDRLVEVKTKVDPDNFFRNEQSFPLLPAYQSF